MPLPLITILSREMTNKLNELLYVWQKGDPPRENPYPDRERASYEEMQRAFGTNPDLRIEVPDGTWVAVRYKGKRARYYQFHKKGGMTKEYWDMMRPFNV